MIHSKNLNYYHEDTPWFFRDKEKDINEYDYYEAIVRISLSFMGREICVDSLDLTPDEKVLPFNTVQK
jgi:hypothetical protein